jgi:hypothetical protein
MRATIIGVIGGFIGIAFLIKSANAAKASADAARDSAEAARNSSTAVVNAERPWMFIQISVSNQAFVPEGPPEHLRFSVTFKNWGTTPAEIIMFVDRLEARGMNPEAELPVPAKYAQEGEVIAHTRMVPPGETWHNPPTGSFWAEEWLIQDDWQEIRKSRKRLVYWGRLRYRDLVEDSKTIHELKSPLKWHETCFCYFWSPSLNDFLICGPFGYNKHT